SRRADTTGARLCRAPEGHQGRVVAADNEISKDLFGFKRRCNFSIVCALGPRPDGRGLHATIASSPPDKNFLGGVLKSTSVLLSRFRSQNERSRGGRNDRS